jgi:hypothetical protein
MGDIQKCTLLQNIPHHDVLHCSQTVTENKWLMEMIPASYCWQIINCHSLTALLAVKHNAVKRSTELITSLHSKSYRPSGILIHRQNSYALRSRRRTGRHEAQSRESVNKVKKLSVCISVYRTLVLLCCDKNILLVNLIRNIRTHNCALVVL